MSGQLLVTTGSC